MTTIAWKNGVVATDSQSTSSYKRFDAVKACRIDKGPFTGHVLAFAGLYALFGVIKAQVESGELQPISTGSDDGDATVLLIGRRIAYRMESQNMTPVEVKSPYAIGSGECFAMGAMLAGAEAEDAVRIASRLDIYTGGKVRSITI